MTWTDPPAILTALRSQIVAADAWTAAEADIHYPRYVPTAGKTLWAVLVVDSRSVERRFVGVNLPSGTLRILLYSTGSPGALETLAQSLGDQVCTEVGIEGLTVADISEAEEADEATQAEDGALCTCTITLNYGLD